RYANEKDETLPSLAAELVSLRPNVIVAIGTPATQAAKSASQSIPIVFARVSDPVGLSFCHLARPAGREPHWGQRADPRTRRQATGIAGHCCSEDQARWRPLGSAAPVQPPRSYGARRRRPVFARGALSSPSFTCR